MHKQVRQLLWGLRDLWLYSVLLKDGIPWGMEAFFGLLGKPVQEQVYSVCLTSM